MPNPILRASSILLACSLLATRPGCALAQGAAPAAPNPPAVPASPTAATPPIAPEAPAAPAPMVQTLKVGDPAPEFKVANWIKGAPVERFEPGRVYVVELWATWCGPCIQTMPHLSRMQSDNAADVTVIGVSINDYELEKVSTFVEEQGNRMAYTVAHDTDKSIKENWQDVCGTGAVPFGFIVDREGKIAAMGHPIGLIVPLYEIARGRWDENGEERAAGVGQRFQDAAMLMTTDPAAGRAAMDAAFAEYPYLDDLVYDQMFEFWMPAAGRWDLAQIAAAHVTKRAIKAGDAVQLNSIAWMIVDPEGKVPREKMDLELATLAAENAVAITKRLDPMPLDTLARVCFTKGEVDKAIATQREAVALAGEGEETQELKAELSETLKEYEGAE